MPVGVGLPEVGAPLPVTFRVCAVVICVAAGVTVTVGVVLGAEVTVTGCVPFALADVVEPAPVGGGFPVGVPAPVLSAPAGTVMAALPLASAVAGEVNPPPVTVTVPV